MPSSLPNGDPFVIDELAAVIQAIVDRPGWVIGNRINIHLRATAAGNATVYFNHPLGGYGEGPPILSVDYDGNLREIQGVALSGNPRSGGVTLTLDDQSMDPLPVGTTAAEAQAECEALSNVGVGMVVEGPGGLEHKEEAPGFPFASEPFIAEEIVEERPRRVEERLDGPARGQHVSLITAPREVEEPSQVPEHDRRPDLER